MTYKENIKTILGCYFTGFKEEIIDSACNRILEQEPKGILDKIRAELYDYITHSPYVKSFMDCCRLRDDVMRIIDKYKAESEEE